MSDNSLIPVPIRKQSETARIELRNTKNSWRNLRLLSTVPLRNGVLLILDSGQYCLYETNNTLPIPAWLLVKSSTCLLSFPALQSF